MTEASLKPGWTKVKFGEVVRLCKDRSSDPEADGIERYVGLEHLEPEDLRIRSWGLVADGTTFTSRFKPGQVLFGKRRAYQRKVAVADFEGICSGDIYVFESASPKHLLPQLLPFICQAEYFFEYAIGTSAGSLSPRTNWKQLKNFEFALPSIQDQEELVQILNLIQKNIWAIGDAILVNKSLEESLFNSLLRGRGVADGSELCRSSFGKIPVDWPIRKVSELGNVSYGISAAVSGNTDPSIGWPILTSANITLDGVFDLGKLVYYPEPKKDNFILKKGDVLLNWRSGSQEHVGKVAIFDMDGCWTYASFILRISPDVEQVNNKYLWRFLEYMRKNQVFGRSTSQQINFKMNASYFRNVEVVAPQKEVQDKIVEILEPCWKAGKDLTERLIKAQEVKQLFLNRDLRRV